MTNTPDNFEQALSRRLSRLSHMPVDTGHLEDLVRGQIPPAAATRRGSWMRMLRPIAAVAASLLMVVMIVLALQGRNVQASSDLMVQMHRDIVAGQVDTMRVNSIEEANQAIAAFAGGEDFPRLSAPPASHTMACCMRNVGNKKVACVLLNHGGTPVTMAVADVDAVEMNRAQTVSYNGDSFHVQKSGELTMVTLDRNGHRLCLIGALPESQLIALAQAAKF